MNELKATTVYDAYWKANSVGEGTGIQVYLKPEADEVIAEKDKVIDYARRLVLEDIKIICHQKYKRCLAMAEILEHIVPMTTRKAKWRDKWHKRWLELAEKFKPNKEAKR